MNRGKTRGFISIGLQNPKHPSNVGGALRAAHLFGASLVIIAGERYKQSGANTTQAQRWIPILEASTDVFEHMPHGCESVAVEALDDATPLPEFRHPEQAFYIFGPEAGSLPEHIVNRCAHKIRIPTEACLNLAAAVNVVLYDRLAKNTRR